MRNPEYFMENKDEIQRLDQKTDIAMLEKQVLWAGLRPGMGVADIGCGPGKTTAHLRRLVGPSGSVTGLDISRDRIQYAEKNYGEDGIFYYHGDVRQPLGDFGDFDFIWVRFLLEFYRSSAQQIITNLMSYLRPKGILCLADLDYNCLTHYGLPKKLNNAIQGVMCSLEANTDFDAFAGRKLYSYLFDLGFTDIQVTMDAHHMIYGDINKNVMFNWKKKLEVAAKNAGYAFPEYPDGFEGFQSDCDNFFFNPRRFTYSPIIICSGKKPDNPLKGFKH